MKSFQYGIGTSLLELKAFTVLRTLISTWKPKVSTTQLLIYSTTSTPSMVFSIFKVSIHDKRQKE